MTGARVKKRQLFAIVGQEHLMTLFETGYEYAEGAGCTPVRRKIH